MHLHVTGLENGYQQVEMDEKSIPYRPFTVGPLGFYKLYLHMPFGLTNTPATFQRLMEVMPWGIASPILHYLSG